MAKEIVGYIKLQIPAGKANPSPPVGPALGQKGVNIMGFCNEFNQKTKDVEAGSPVPVVITVYKDKSFSFTTKLAPMSYFIKKAIKLDKGGSKPGQEIYGTIPKSAVRSIAEAKMKDLNAIDVDGAMKMVEGSARSMGLVIGD